MSLSEKIQLLDALTASLNSLPSRISRVEAEIENGYSKLASLQAEEVRVSKLVAELREEVIELQEAQQQVVATIQFRTAAKAGTQTMAKAGTRQAKADKQAKAVETKKQKLLDAVSTLQALSDELGIPLEDLLKAKS